MDQKTLKNSKYQTEEQIADRIRYIVAITGKGPIGKFVGRWWNAVDERGLPAHCVSILIHGRKVIAVDMS